MKRETVEVIKWDVGDIVDISEISGADTRQYKALNNSKQAMILRERGSSYDVLTSDNHCAHIPPQYLDRLKYIRHVDLWEDE